jgi:transposase, IS5 family
LELSANSGLCFAWPSVLRIPPELTRLMKKVTEIAGEAGTKLRDRKRSMQRRLVEIGRATRSKGKAAQEKVKAIYRKLVKVSSRVVGQAKKFSAEIG